MVYSVSIIVKPKNLVDLDVTTDFGTASISSFEETDEGYLGQIRYLDDASDITIESTGYETQVYRISDTPPIIYLIPDNEVEYISDGTNNYPLADITARLMLDDKADISEIPTKTSDLTNDSNFATVSQIPTNNNQLTNGAGYITGISSSDVTSALGYTPANNSNAVKTSGDQTIDGIKTFKAGTITVNKSNMTKGTNPSSALHWQWFSCDKNGTGDANCLGKVITSVEANGNVSTRLVAYKNATGTTNATIGIYYPASGNAYTSAPTPATSDNSTKIATTAFVKSQNYLTTTTKTVANDGCTFVISNGLKIITAEISGGGSSDYSWSYGTTFSNTPKVFVTRRSGDTASTDVNAWVRGTIGKSSCNIFIHASGSYTFQVVAIGN